MLPRDRVLHAIAALGRKDPPAAPARDPGSETRQGFPPVVLPPRKESLDAEALGKFLRLLLQRLTLSDICNHTNNPRWLA